MQRAMGAMDSFDTDPSRNERPGAYFIYTTSRPKLDITNRQMQYLSHQHGQQRARDWELDQLPCSVVQGLWPTIDWPTTRPVGCRGSCHDDIARTSRVLRRQVNLGHQTGMDINILTIPILTLALRFLNLALDAEV